MNEQPLLKKYFAYNREIVKITEPLKTLKAFFKKQSTKRLVSFTVIGFR